MEKRDINKVAYKGFLNFFYAQMNGKPELAWGSTIHWVRVNLNITEKRRVRKWHTEGYSRPNDKTTK